MRRDLPVGGDRSSHQRQPGTLFGRDDDIEMIHSFVERAAVSGGPLVLFGSPGVGKTVLLEAAAAQAEAAGMLVVRGVGAEFEGEISFAGLHQVLHTLMEGISSLTATYRQALGVALGTNEGPPPDQLQVSVATLALLTHMAAERPLLLVVDDLPWLDRVSARVLSFVARRLTGTRVGFLGASRSGQESFFDSAGMPEHEVKPLDEAAAIALVEHRFPNLAPWVRMRLLAESQGNPLALLELPVSLSEQQRIGTSALPEVLPLGTRLQAIFASRIRRLPAATQQLLLLAVLEGVCPTVGPLTGDRWLGRPDLAPAERAGLVRIDDRTGRLVFRHPLTRSAVMELSTSDQRREAHRMLADQSMDRPERRAWHLAHATVEPDEQVAAFLEQVGRDITRRGDVVGGIRILLRAADLSPQGYYRSRRIAEAAYLGADLTGDLRDVPQLLEEARRADGGRAGPLVAAIAAAHHLLLSGEGDIDTAHRLLAGAIEMQPQPYDATNATIIEALYILALVSHGGHRGELWEAVHTRLARVAPRVPSRLALHISTTADPARTAVSAVDQLDAAIATLDQEFDPVRIIRLAFSSMYVDRLPGCRAALRRLLREGRRTQAVTLQIQALSFLSRDLFTAGEWNELQELAEEGRRLAEAHSYRLLSTNFLYRMALVAAARGDDVTSTAVADDMIRWSAPRRIGFHLACAAHVKALAAISRGDFENAYRHASAVSRAGELASHVPTALFLIMDLVEAAVRTGRHAEAAAHVTAVHEAGVAEISGRLALIAHASAALAATDREAGELFEMALAVPAADRWPFDLARVQLAYGERLRRGKSHARARVHLTAALEAFQRLGATPWMERAGNELRATGIAVGRALGTGPASLTPQQLEIAKLAAAGLTNKQIGQRLHLSPRTVGFHLYQVFPKLGVTSRAALRDALANLPAD
ncbi:AAA family ATPase [Micromonospora purpureochromogenes]|uniref:helix-turn-helix transcriptional regulator n=1 Tax=Micromonospora purpureochromogenes TaxID=47872 RepID=UPI0033F99340